MDEFDKFLQDSDAKNDKNELQQLKLEQEQQKVDALLDQEGVASPFRFDSGARDAASQIVHDELKLYFYDLAVEAEVQDPDQVAHVHAGAELAMAISRDAGILTRMMIVRTLYDHTGDIARTTDAKKEQMAELYVEYGREFGSPWMSFAANYMPGTPLDPSSVDDAMYIMEAQRRHDERIAQGKVYDVIIQRYSRELIGDNPSDEELIRFGGWINACVGLSSSLGSGGANREEAIEHVVREYGFSRQAVESFLVDVDI